LKKIKIITILGARPQFIKAAAFSKAIAQQNELEEIIIHTGQHFDSNMSEVFFEEMQIPKPHYQLSINGLTHGAMTGRMLEEIETILISEKPNCVLVYGDTNSTLAGALAAKKLNIKVAHVEAGLRSFNMHMPEEINRILTDRISDFLFCPTAAAMENLKKEGFENMDCMIENTGDIMYDSMLLFKEFSNKNASIAKNLNTEDFLLCTIHRAENTDDNSRLNTLFETLNILAERQTIILPLHPRTKQKVTPIILHKNIIITEPLGYFDMLYLLQKCKLVLTDSGGLQKEAFFNKKYCITLRDETEWVELVESGNNMIAGSSPQKILSAYNHFIDLDFNSIAQFYGSGNTSQKIIKSLKENLC